MFYAQLYVRYLTLQDVSYLETSFGKQFSLLLSIAGL